MLTLRPAQTNDINRLARWSEQIANHEQHYNASTFVSFKSDFSTQLSNWLKDLIAAPHANIPIAYQDQRAIGFSLALLVQANNPFTIYPFHGVIQLLWVDEAYRRMGAATRLVEVQEQFLRGLQVPFIEIQYSDGNPHGEKFWSKMGYQGALHALRKFY